MPKSSRTRRSSKPTASPLPKKGASPGRSSSDPPRSTGAGASLTSSKTGVPSRSAPQAGGDPAPSSTASSNTPLLRLERPFDLDEFCQMLGETKVSATVPREHLSEVLKRVVEFMEFGIYTYAVVVLPAASPTLEKFVVQLDRIDFDNQRKGWTPFREKGRSDSPFGPNDRGKGSVPPHP